MNITWELESLRDGINEAYDVQHHSAYSDAVSNSKARSDSYSLFIKPLLNVDHIKAKISPEHKDLVEEIKRGLQRYIRDIYAEEYFCMLDPNIRTIFEDILAKCKNDTWP